MLDPVCLTDPADVEVRLAALGLDIIVLTAAVDDGVREASLCTAFDPPTTAPFLAWAKTTRSLREHLVPLGWTPDDRGLYSTVVNSTGNIRVVVETGNSDTGREHGRPTTKSPKGTLTERAVYGNSHQMAFSEFDETFRQVEGPTPLQTWMLLFTIDRSANEARVELSLPAGMDGRFPTAWDQRIILPPLPLVYDISRLSDPEEEEIEVDVRRRVD